MTDRRHWATRRQGQEQDQARSPAGSSAPRGCSAASAGPPDQPLEQPGARRGGPGSGSRGCSATSGKRPVSSNRTNSLILARRPAARPSAAAASTLGRREPRLAPRGQQRRRAAPTTPSSASDQERLDDPEDPAAITAIAAGAQELTSATIRVRLHASDPIGRGVEALSWVAWPPVDGGVRPVRLSGSSGEPPARRRRRAGRGSREAGLGQARSRSSNRRNANNNAAPLYNTQ